MMKRILIFSAVFMSLIWTAPGHASPAPRLERIGGNFTVAKITRLPKGGFVVEFKASEGTPPVKTLRLESDHINAGLNEGDTLRLSADVVASSGDTAEVAQVVLYIPGKVGPTPVWMLSKGSKPMDPPAKLIDLHAPSTDYAVF
jgi:hypothetical protein